MTDQELLEKVGKYIAARFETHAVPSICFHNLASTNSIVKAVKKISTHSKLLKKELTVLEVAAWFHNVGYLENSREYKQNSAKLARVFLEQENITETVIQRVTDLIMATRDNHQFADQLEEIMFDAELYYFSKTTFLVKNELLRRETEFLVQREITQEEWNRDMVTLMETHQYSTTYCRTEVTAKKTRDLEKLKALLPSGAGDLASKGDQRTKKIKKEHLKAELGPEKGIETMFKIAASNNQRLFTLADNKAHILITVNSIIMSILVSVLIRKLAEAYPSSGLYSVYITLTLLQNLR